MDGGPLINKLKLNGEKTDIVITCSISLLKKPNISTIKIGYSTSVSTIPHVKNQGITSLQTLS